jgi:hypothetical protein
MEGILKTLCAVQKGVILTEAAACFKSAQMGSGNTEGFERQSRAHLRQVLQGFFIPLTMKSHPK